VAIHFASASDPVYQANPTQHSARRSYYGINATPTLMVDGLYDAWPLDTFQGYYDTRMAVPCYLDITVTPEAGSSSSDGTLTFALATDIGLDTDASIHAMINECGIPGTGVYAGVDFNYALRWNLFGTNGTVVNFGSSSETINLSVDYLIDPSWNWEELYLTTFVQSDVNHEILNSHMVKLTDLVSTGIEGDGIDVPNSGFTVNSPALGAITFSATSGTMSLFSLDGRLLDSMPVQSGTGTFTPDTPGMYILRLETPQGVFSSKSVVLIR
jgi:hypothetical protein